MKTHSITSSEITELKKIVKNIFFDDEVQGWYETDEKKRINKILNEVRKRRK